MYKDAHEITKLKNPNVKKFRGKVKNFIIGFKTIEKKERIAAKLNNELALSNSNPFIRLSTINNIAVKVKKCNKIFFIRKYNYIIKRKFKAEFILS